MVVLIGISDGICLKLNKLCGQGGLFLFFTELFGKNKGISRFHLTYLDGLFIRRKAVAMANGQGRGPPRPKFSQTNLLKK